MREDNDIIRYILHQALINVSWYDAYLKDDYPTECLVSYIVGEEDNVMFEPDLEHVNIAESRIREILTKIENDNES